MGSPVDIKSYPADPGPLGTGSAAEGNWHFPPLPWVLGITAMELLGACWGVSATGRPVTTPRVFTGPWATSCPSGFLTITECRQPNSIDPGS